MNRKKEVLKTITRRHFFFNSSMSIGSIALAGLMDQSLFSTPSLTSKNPLAVKPSHFAPKAKNIIFLFMSGGPSQIDLFEDKPKLNQLDGQEVPTSATGTRVPRSRSCCPTWQKWRTTSPSSSLCTPNSSITLRLSSS